MELFEQLTDALKPSSTAAETVSNKWEGEGGIAAAGTRQGRELPNLG